MPDNNNTKTIIISVTIIVVALIIYLIVRQNSTPYRPDEQEEVTCEAKKVYRYKHPIDAFPIFASQYNTEIAFASDVLKRMADSARSNKIDVATKNKIVELQDKLNQDNILFSMGLRSYFMNVNSDPCNNDLRNKYAAYTEEMTNRMINLRTVTAQVTTITQKGTIVDSLQKIPESVAKSDTALVALQMKNLPAYRIVKDSLIIKNSIKKFDELLQENHRVDKSLNNIHGVQPQRN